jgi:hypothetical protein
MCLSTPSAELCSTKLHNSPSSLHVDGRMDRQAESEANRHMQQLIIVNVPNTWKKQNDMNDEPQVLLHKQ